MYRTIVILRHTFREVVVQPIFSLLLGLGGAILLIFSMLPFFTLGEDTTMFSSVGLDVVLLLVLISTLFATSRSIFDEIEDRTMLTLMSKPVRKWEVLLGKYLGIILAAGLSVAVLGAIFVLCCWWRVPNDYLLSQNTIDDSELKKLLDLRLMHSAGVMASLILVWLQICVLAAISVALSTRFSLVVNLPAVILIYVAGNLTRFLYPMEGQPLVVRVIGNVAASILPFLQTFDFRAQTIYRQVAVPGTRFATNVDPTSVSLAVVEGYILVAAVYAITYSAFALGSGLLLFQNRELGGGEG